MDWTFYLGILLIASSTYLIRVGGYFFLRNRQLSPRAEKVMEAVPGCVLISVIAPEIVSGNLATTLAVVVTLFATLRFSLLPTVLISIASTALFRAVF
ncbi:hypothetical protein B0187_00285 [Haemophilus paracuniculus]|uniref:Branched-chain amino acid transport n=1 Tax=Haemophilus paracuniculus TaxID=734 RepID=A0A1T0AV56_9PAST|nr:AzlD family protein [Haemophilus paracuniculus]OOS00774.1 hypothetical protein B0187_00285 [Haemophilus paracuniculus]